MIHDKELTELMQAVSQYMAKIPPADGVAFSSATAILCPHWTK
jgi:hypothetical protein